MAAPIIFIVVIISIILLFMRKQLEMQPGVVFMSEYRQFLDKKVAGFEAQCRQRCTVSNIFHTIKHIYNLIAHKFAKVTASIAKKVEWRARSMAHKSAKAKQNGVHVRENGYLTDVQKHKDSLDLVKVAEETKL